MQSILYFLLSAILNIAAPPVASGPAAEQTVSRTAATLASTATVAYQDTSSTASYYLSRRHALVPIVW